jgi:hypothetical protein
MCDLPSAADKAAAKEKKHMNVKRKLKLTLTNELLKQQKNVVFL